MKLLTRLAPVVACLAYFAGCGGGGGDAPAQTADEKRICVVSIPPLASFCRALAGDAARVDVLLPDEANPQTYAPTPRRLAELADADVYFHVGLPFEQRLIGKLASLAPDARRVNLREHVDLLPMSASCGHCHEHGHGSSHSQGGAYDPHVWLSPTRMKTMVGAMASTLTNMSPSRASEIVAAETTLRARLDRLDATLRAALDNVTNNAFLVFHSAWRYFAHDYGLHEISIQMEGKEPTARELEATLASAKKHGVTILVTQPQFSDRLARMVARETGTRCVEVDPLSPDYAGTLTNFARVLAGEE